MAHGILTVTLNPAVDVGVQVERVVPTHKLRCWDAKRDPGGGGINVARVAQRFGARTLAAYACGGLVGALLEQLLNAEGVEALPLPVAGETRENLTAFETATGDEFRFVLPGPTLSPAEWAACAENIAPLAQDYGFVVLSGSLPPGAPADAYAQLAKRAEALGARVVVDAAGDALKHALGAGAYLIKPNLKELQDLTGEALDDISARVSACRTLIGANAAEVIALSMGAEGALLVSKDVALRAQTPPVEVVSSLGAGDSFVAGIVCALDAGATLEEAFRRGVAAGSAALLTPGTDLCSAADTDRLAPLVTITAL